MRLSPGETLELWRIVTFAVEAGGFVVVLIVDRGHSVIVVKLVVKKSLKILVLI